MNNNNNSMETNSMANNRPKRERTSVFKSRIERIANKIVELVNYKKYIFNIPLKVEIEEDIRERTVFVNLYLTPNTYAIGLYYNTFPLSGKCTYVNSDLGMKTGTFLFHLLLLLNAELGVEDFTLENYTGDQVRGAKGIYKLFKVDKRGQDASVFIGASLAEQISEAQGNMRLQLGSDTKQAIIEEFYNIMDKLTEANINTNNPNNPWQPTFVDGITEFLKKMSNKYALHTFGGRKKKNMKKRKNMKKMKSFKKTKKNKKYEKIKKYKKKKSFKKKRKNKKN